MGNEKVTDSQLLDTQAITEPDFSNEAMKAHKRNKNFGTISFIAGFLFVMLLLGSVLYIVIAVHKDQRTANTRVDITVEQLNDVLLPALEEHIIELNARIDSLMKDTETLKDNCTDIRYIIAPKFGKSALVPIHRIKTPVAAVEEKIRLPKIQVPRKQ